jgi:sulfatase maturation enzyme AslB (radical SAM superfamily)
MNHKDMLTNPSFCPMPWTGLMYNVDGTVKNCIRSAEPIGNIAQQPIESILLGQKNTRNQQLIDQKQPVSGCQPCYHLERGKQRHDIISDRIFYIRELKKTPVETYQPGNFDLQTIDVRWTNLCNFACVYCGPEFSSRWASELGTFLNQPSEHQKQEFKNYILSQAPRLRHVYLAGGEPLLMKENLELLDQLDPETTIRVNTNLSKTDTQVFERICEFKNVHWTISVETMQEEFEYIRFGGSWKDFESNLGHIKSLNHKISFNMIWFLLNPFSIFECVEYLQAQGFHNNSFVIGALLGPEYLNIRHLPDSVLQSLQIELQRRIDQQPGYLLEDSYRNMLHYIQQPFEKDLEQSLQLIKTLDQRRGLDSKKIFTHLYQSREENKHGQTI